MKRVLSCTMGVIVGVLFIGVFVALPATVTLTVTPSTDDATVEYYAVEENGVVLSQTCDPGCTEIQLMDRDDGTYNYRVGATRGGLTTWSNSYQVVVDCGPYAPAAATITNGSYVCD